MSELELLQEIALPDGLETREYEVTPGGAKKIFTLKRFRNIGDYVAMSQRIEGREGALKAHKNKLPVLLSDELAVGLAGRIDVETVNGKPTIYVTSAQEVNMATVLEQGVVDPSLSWQAAVIICKTNARMAAAIANDLREMIGGQEAEDRAKKGSKTTGSKPEDSGV